MELRCWRKPKDRLLFYTENRAKEGPAHSSSAVHSSVLALWGQNVAWQEFKHSLLQDISFLRMTIHSVKRQAGLAGLGWFSDLITDSSALLFST